MCPNPEPKPIVAATKKPQPDDPALFELAKRVNPILIVPNAERDAQDFDGIFGRPCALLPGSRLLNLDTAARIARSDARSRGRTCGETDGGCDD